MTIGRFTDAAVTLYDKLDDLVTAQQVWSEKQFGPARERDARGPLNHLRKECTELYLLIAQWNAGKLPATEDVDKEIADLLILLLDILWRTGRKFNAAVDAALAKMRENVGREWPPYKGWVIVETNEARDGQSWDALLASPADTEDAEVMIGHGATRDAALEDAYRQIRDLNARAVEHVRGAGQCPNCGDPAHATFCTKPDQITKEVWQKMSDDERLEAERALGPMT